MFCCVTVSMVCVWKLVLEMDGWIRFFMVDKVSRALIGVMCSHFGGFGIPHLLRDLLLQVFVQSLLNIFAIEKWYFNTYI